LLVVPVLALGVVLDQAFRLAASDRTLDDARSSARLLAQTSVQPAIAGRDLAAGLDVAAMADLGAAVEAAVRQGEIVGVRLRSVEGDVAFPPQDVGAPQDPGSLADARTAVNGVHPTHLVTTALPERVGGGQVQAVRVFTPVVAPTDGRVLGTLEVLLPYDKVARQVQRQTKVFMAILTVGLILLYGLVAGLGHAVTRRLRTMLELTDHAAHHDSLTGLPNRALFRKRAQAALASGSQQLVVAIIDLDRFKQVNDTLGHERGDILLRIVGQRLTDAVRTDDTVARLGGDEFGLVLPGGGLDDATPVLDRVRHALTGHCEDDGHTLPVGGSIGVAAAPLHGDTVEVLLRHADAAMYVAKRSGRAMVTADTTTDTTSLGRLLMHADLARAISGEELVLHYQPLVRLSDGTTAKVEALVRWQHPVRGLLAPGEFIPVAQENGLIDALTTWVVRRALADLASMPAGLPVAVNVSPSTLRDPAFVEHVESLLAAAGVPPERLVLEMTETALVENVVGVRASLERLRAIGIGLSLDDFGQGSTSLSLLRSMPFTEVKVDRAFVASLQDDSLDSTIVKAVVSIAHHAGMAVVVEGIEDAEVLERVRRLEADLAQGYHLGRPLPLVRASPAAPAGAAPTIPVAPTATPRTALVKR